MRPGPNYYQFLGVSQAAPAEQIRSAYLNLMKQYHPDLKGEVRPAPRDDVAALLNLCYDVLKDPQKRALYDDFLEARDDGSDPLRPRVLLTGRTTHRRHRQWDASSIAAATLALLIAATLMSVPWLPFASRTASQGAQRRLHAATAPFAPQSQISAIPLSHEIHLAMSAPSGLAMAESRQCFASAREHSSVAETERCIIFDDAYVEWARIGSQQSPRPLYFDDGTIHDRHKQALSAVKAFSESRLDQLKNFSLTQLLVAVRTSFTADSEAQGAASEELTPDLSRWGTG